MLYIPLKHKSVGCLLSFLYNEIKAIVNGYGSLEKCKLASPPQEKWIKLCRRFCTHSLHTSSLFEEKALLQHFSLHLPTPSFLLKAQILILHRRMTNASQCRECVCNNWYFILWCQATWIECFMLRARECAFISGIVGEENFSFSLLGSSAGLMIKLT